MNFELCRSTQKRGGGNHLCSNSLKNVNFNTSTWDLGLLIDMRFFLYSCSKIVIRTCKLKQRLKITAYTFHQQCLQCIYFYTDNKSSSKSLLCCINKYRTWISHLV